MNKWQNIAAKAQKLIADNQFILYLAVFTLVFFIFLMIQAHPTFLDPDSFYHLKMIRLISEQGPVINFPWLQFTVLKNFFIDQHFLYHVAGIPFVVLFGDLAGFKFYTAILATLFILGCYLFLKRDKIKYSEIFILILLSCQGFLFRISLGKATAFSLILLFACIYCLFKKKNWWLFFLSWIYVWSYGGFILVWVMAILYLLAESLEFLINSNWPQKIWPKLVHVFKTIFSPSHLRTAGAAFSGVILGLVINPYFPKNIKFIWEQLVQIGIINYRGAVNVGGEWYPYKLGELFTNVGVASLLGVALFILFFIYLKKQNKYSIFFLLTTVFFTIFTLKSKRYVEYLGPHLVFFLAYATTCILGTENLGRFWAKFKTYDKTSNLLLKFILVIVVIFFPIIMVKDIYQTADFFRGGIRLANFSGVSKYLLDNSQPGDIIMQTDWDDFPMLFYHNSKDYYIVGLDPTFMYNYDQKLYKLFADITMAKVSTNLAQQVKDNFKASYFVVDKDRDQLNKYLQADAGFVKVYEDSDAWLYKLK